MATDKQIWHANRDAQARIEMFYPITKQLNIGRMGWGYTVLDKTKMDTFIDAVRARCKQYEQAQNPTIDYSDMEP